MATGSTSGGGGDGLMPILIGGVGGLVLGCLAAGGDAFQPTSGEVVWVWLLRGLGLPLMLVGAIQMMSLPAQVEAGRWSASRLVRGAGSLLAGGAILGSSGHGGGYWAVGIGLWVAACLWYLVRSGQSERE